MQPKFNYVDLSHLMQTHNSSNNEKSYDEWHDLIDIKVPRFNDPSILLCPRVPTPLHHRNPRSILTQIDQGWWDRTRQRVYAANNYYCACCGVHKTQQKGFRKYLDAHEYYDIDYKTGEVRLKMIVPLCTMCHSYIHFGRLSAKYEAGEVSEKDFFAVLSHGNTLLKKAGLPMKDLDPNKDDNIYQIPWKSWKLILKIEGKDQEFYSLYENEEELKAHYT